jgi:tetratricopeptide (TPR) repeat protein
MKKILPFIIFFLAIVSLANAQSPDGGLSHYVDGMNYQKTGQHQRAIDEFNKALRREPSNYKYLHAKAISEFKMRDNESSINSLNSLLKLKDDFAPAYVLLAQIYYQQGDYNKAAEFYDKAAIHEPDPNNKFKYKMMVTNKYIKDGNMKVAYEKAKELRAIAPKDLKAAYYFARLANKVKKYEEAKNAILEVEPSIKSSKDNAKYYFELGYAYYHSGDYAKSKTAFEKTQGSKYFAATEKFSAKYFYRISIAYYKFHENETSKKYLDQAEKIQQELAEVHVLRAQLSKRMSSKENNASTISHYENAVKTQTDPAKRESIYEKIAELYLEAENYEACLRTSDEALKINPNDAKAILNKINALYKLNKLKEAVDFAQNALRLRLEPNTAADISFLLGLSAKKIGDKNLAKQSFMQLQRTSLRDAAEIELKAMGAEISPEEEIPTED